VNEGRPKLEREAVSSTGGGWVWKGADSFAFRFFWELGMEDGGGSGPKIPNGHNVQRWKPGVVVKGVGRLIGAQEKLHRRDE
jgi:hypothetical protein